MLCTDNLGLLPYRRRIVAVSESQVLLLLYQQSKHKNNRVLQLVDQYMSNNVTNQRWRKSDGYKNNISMNSCRKSLFLLSCHPQ